jgi:hypothetical protein
MVDIDVETEAHSADTATGVPPPLNSGEWSTLTPDPDNVAGRSHRVGVRTSRSSQRNRPSKSSYAVAESFPRPKFLPCA